MLKKRHSPEFTIYFSIIIFGVAFLFLAPINQDIARGGFLRLASYYVGLNFQPLKMAALWGSMICYFFVIFRLLIFLFSSYMRGVNPRTFLSLSSFKRIAVTLGRDLLNFSKVGLLLIFSIFLESSLLSEINVLNRVNLKDELLFKLDSSLTGGIPFVFLHSFIFPAWFVKLVVFSFQNLDVMIILSLFYFFYRDKRLFREFVGAFCLGLILMLPLWIFFPALSPHDRFIDNVYRLPVPQGLAGLLQSYHPQDEVMSFLTEMRSNKLPLNALPTSTMPSAHVVWVALLGYYIYRARRLSVFLIITPFLILSAFGTVFLLQHYFVDIPAGIVIAILSILGARCFDLRQYKGAISRI